MYLSLFQRNNFLFRRFLLALPITVASSTYAQPANDLCSNATPIECNSITDGTTTGSTNTGFPGTCITSLSSAGGVWYTVQGWGGEMKALLCGSDFDTKMGVFTGSCGSLVCVAGNDDDFGPGGTGMCEGGVVSSTQWVSGVGITYYIYVTGFSSATGDLVLTVLCGDMHAPCVANGMTLELQTDADGDQTSYEILPEGLDLPVCSGSGFPNEAIITSTCCVPDGCYRLIVMDSAGDGMTTGGYTLRDANGDRVIDNRNNFSTGTESSLPDGAAFCLPIGTDRTIFTSCDKEHWVSGEFIMASMNPAVSAEWIDGAPNAQQDDDSGYQFWFFDPNGDFSYIHFRTHRTSHGYGTGPARAAHLRLNNWAPVNHLPENMLLNVRIRGMVNGEPVGEWGPACRFKIDPAAAECPATKLMDIPYNQFLSCGEYREFAFGSYVHARPVSGASQYQFRFRQPAEGFEKVRTANSYYTQLWWAVDPLIEGSQYEVDVRAKVDGNWCPWGDICTLNIGTDPGMNGGNDQRMLQEPHDKVASISIWPNPNSGDVLNIALTGERSTAGTVRIEMFDMYGKRVLDRTMTLEGTQAALSLNNDLAPGMYIVNLTDGSDRYTERLVIQSGRMH